MHNIEESAINMQEFGVRNKWIVLIITTLSTRLQMCEH